MSDGAPTSPRTPHVTPHVTTDADVLARLDVLEAESNARRAELRRLAAELPVAVSRRAVVRSLVADLRHAPGKRAIARRAAAKLARAPRAAWRRVGGRARA